MIYLDNAATTYPKPERVYRAADEFYRRYGGNAGRGANPLARKGAELIAETRTMLAHWLGAPSPERIIFTPSATVALNLVILGTKLRPGDVAYVTPLSIIRCCGRWSTCARRWALRCKKYPSTIAPWPAGLTD